MSERVRIPGPRDVRATLDGADEDASAAVVACPPHPKYGGNRHDGRLEAVSAAVRDRGIDCLRIDFGDWDRGTGEVADAVRACEWARERYETVGLFGYSFGAGVALRAANDEAADPARLAVLAPPASIADLDVLDDVDALGMPALFVVGERDDTVDWEPVVDRATAAGHRVERVPGDHFFVGQLDKVTDVVGPFFAELA